MIYLLECWDDEELRNTILTVGLEEGTFYEPNAKIEVKCFVVVTIRNSLLETLASDDYKSLSATIELSDDEVKNITSAAIEYFSKVDFAELEHSVKSDSVCNVYKRLKEQYPVAWKAISMIGNTKRKSVRYESVKGEVIKDLISLISQRELCDEMKYNKTILSGYDESIDETLMNILTYAYSNPRFVFF